MIFNDQELTALSLSIYSKAKQEGDLDLKSIFQSFFADFPAIGEGKAHV